MLNWCEGSCWAERLHRKLPPAVRQSLQQGPAVGSQTSCAWHLCLRCAAWQTLYSLHQMHRCLKQCTKICNRVPQRRAGPHAYGICA